MSDDNKDQVEVPPAPDPAPPPTKDVDYERLEKYVSSQVSELKELVGNVIKPSSSTPEPVKEPPKNEPRPSESGPKPGPKRNRWRQFWLG